MIRHAVPDRDAAACAALYAPYYFQPEMNKVLSQALYLAIAAMGLNLLTGFNGQVSIGQTIVKANAKKVRRLGKGDVIAGFAGATADAFTLFERFEAKLEKHQGHLVRAAIELTKDWRTDRVLRRLEDVLDAPFAGALALRFGGGLELYRGSSFLDQLFNHGASPLARTAPT